MIKTERDTFVYVFEQKYLGRADIIEQFNYLLQIPIN